MGVYKGKWYYETPNILNGDTTVIRRNLINDGLWLRINLRGKDLSKATTFYGDMNSGHGGSQVYPTMNPKSAIEETRQVILTTPKDQWEEKPFTFKSFIDAVKSFYNLVKR